MRHVVKEDHRFADIDRITRHYAESSYRRGVQQALYFAWHELRAGGHHQAADRVWRMQEIAGEMRFQKAPHEWYLDRLLHKLRGRAPPGPRRRG